MTTPITRRRLLQLAGAAGGALALDAVGLVPPASAARAPAGSRWSLATTWGGAVPGPGDVATITTTIVVDVDAEVAGIEVAPGGALVFDPTRSVILTTTGNVVVRGTLTMRPVPSARHRLVFAGIDESRFVGGGLDVVASDVGLWVMDDGQLDIAGPAKTSWARLAGDGLKGTTVLQLDRAPTGWAVGDRLAIMPTSPPSTKPDDSWWAGFSDATISAVSGSRVTLEEPLAYDHPRIGDAWAAEVANLTRNVELEGTPTGRTHVFIRSTRAQTLAQAAIRYAGPRRKGAKVAGRWPVHFHQADDASRGTVVDGVVVTDAGSHAFVAHESNGVTFRECVAYQVEEHAYWWDEGDDTDDIVYESCLAARISADALGVSGFYLGRGARNAVRDCVAVGAVGGGGNGFVSPASVSNGQWAIDDCLAHNNRHAGFKAYINTDKLDDKVVSRFTGYHNDLGIDHGSYLNSFLYEAGTLYGNLTAGVELSAVADARGIRFLDMTVDGAGLSPHGVVNDRHQRGSVYPTVFESCTFRGHTLAAVALVVADPNSADRIDLVNCTYEGNELWLAADIHRNCEVRLQDAVHGALSARRYDQPGTLVPAWNARTQKITPFA
ncbi:MAG: G8 domain-containing protein [Acidimicrobiales bacterium]